MRIGTRGSALALAQARWVAGELASHGVASEIVTVANPGDRGQRGADKARWTSGLERALLEGEIDVAVHSAKDVPGELAPGTGIAAIPAREDPADVICGVGSLDELPAGARVGTSSLRRSAQLLALREDLEIVELHGNVDTRLRKLAEGEADALVLAAAGLTRLGRADAIGAALTALIPAPGQGALLLQTRADDRVTAVATQPLSDSEAQTCVLAERAFASTLHATCNSPLGASATPAGKRVRLRGWIGLPDGSRWIADQLAGAPEAVATALAGRMISLGARELLAHAEEMAAG
ncbi:MAG: hydroxymethylbilane synthase [Solirubrobacteraceae bacterium]